ncbi:uncharacterized protein LJ206_006511 isoform 4-T6 [Theristicus caerulescens]
MGTAAFHTTAPTATEMKWHLYTFHHPDCKTESIPMLLVLFGNLPQPSPRWMVTIDHTGPTAGKFICSWLDRVSVSVTSPGYECTITPMRFWNLFQSRGLSLRIFERQQASLAEHMPLQCMVFCSQEHRFLPHLCS